MARTPEAPAGSTPAAELTHDSAAGGKGRPTPTRKEKEQARKRPLVVNDRAERRRREREAAAVQREKARIGMANGDERYLGPRDRGPQRRFIRDYMDARWSIGELLLPTIVLYLVTSFVPAQLPMLIGLALVLFILTGVFIDTAIVSVVLKRRLEEKFGTVQKGYRFYAGVRSAYPRPLRMPKTQVKRGEFPH